MTAHAQCKSIVGFSIVEIMVVLAVILLFAGLSVTWLMHLSRESALKAAHAEVYQALVDARNKTLASRNATVYGVRIGTSTVTRFQGPMFVAGNPSNVVYAFEGGVTATGTLVTSGTTVVFGRLSGVPSATGTVLLTAGPSYATRTITIHASGLIE